MARSTLANLIQTLRGMCEAGTADWALGTVNYWSDDHLQAALDRYRRDVYRAQLTPVQTYAGGSVEYKHYYTGAENLEVSDGGTAVFVIDDGLGNAVGTAQYSMDYDRGHAEFTADTGGSALYWSGRAFDLNRAAADVWRQKAAHYAPQYNFSTDNHRVEKGSVYEHCLAMAVQFEQRASSGGVIDLSRGDTDAY